MLERLGQKKVSIFMEPLDSVDVLDKMARKGFAATKDATVVGKPTKPTDLSVLPTKCESSSASGVTFDGATRGNTGGAAMRVFIASCATLPSRSFDGKIVHVPYAQLLHADGTPKEAKDIRAILSKAGVPRYVELITVADDPGEAAANYYLLKLMGFADVKVML